MDHLRLVARGLRSKPLGVLGSTSTVTAMIIIIPFMTDGWDAAAGFPAMTGNGPFLMKDVVLLAVSVYLLKQDLARAVPLAMGCGSAGRCSSSDRLREGNSNRTVRWISRSVRNSGLIIARSAQHRQPGSHRTSLFADW